MSEKDFVALAAEIKELEFQILQKKKNTNL
jgi:hypothetical protein